MRSTYQKHLIFRNKKLESLILQSNTFNSKNYTRPSTYEKDDQALDEDIMACYA